MVLKDIKSVRNQDTKKSRKFRNQDIKKSRNLGTKKNNQISGNNATSANKQDKPL